MIWSSFIHFNFYFFLIYKISLKGDDWSIKIKCLHKTSEIIEYKYVKVKVDSQEKVQEIFEFEQGDNRLINLKLAVSSIIT